MTSIMFGVTLLLGTVTVQAQNPRQVRRYAIPPGLLADVVIRFALDSGLMLSYTAQDIAGKRSPGLNGRHAPQAALARLLTGTGLQARAQPNGGYVLQPAPAVPLASRARVSVLPAVTVKAQGGLHDHAAHAYRVQQSDIAGFSHQDLLDTPASVKVLPAELLANQTIDSIAGINRVDASVSSSERNAGWYSAPSIRGFELDNLGNYRYNGLATVNQQATALENKARVEILKGPSALQAGFAAPGGIINYVTKRPAARDLSDVHFSANQYGKAKVHVDLSRRSGDGRLGVRVNATMEDERSHVREIDGARRFVSLAADWRLTPDTHVQFDVEHERRNQRGQPYLERDIDGRLPTGLDPRSFLGQRWARYPTALSIVSGKVEHFLNGAWSVTLDASATDLKRDQNQIWAISNIEPAGDGQAFLYRSLDQTRRVRDARFTVNGELQTGAVAHKLAFGLQANDTASRYGPDFWGAIGDTNIHRPVSIAFLQPDLGPARTTERTSDRALFVHDALSLGDTWTLHLGARHVDREQTDYDVITGDPTRRYRKTVITPSAALVFKPVPGVTTYVSHIEGLQNGGEAPVGTSNAGRQLAPVVSQQWELGVKAALSPALAVEAALFRIQNPAEYTSTNDDGTQTYVQSGLRRHQGLELSLIGKPSLQWTVFASAMLLDARFVSAGDPAIQGKRPADVPRQRVALVAEYGPRALPGWTFVGNWTHTGEREVVDENTGQAAPAYHVFGLGLRYDTRFGKLPATLRLNVDNVFDKRYWAYANDYVNAGAPRTVNAGLSLHF